MTSVQPRDVSHNQYRYILQMGDNHKRWPGMQTCLRLRQHISAHTLTVRDDRDHVESETAAGGPFGRASWRLLRLISACHMPLSLSSIRYSSLVLADSETSTHDPAYHIVFVCRKIGTCRVMNAALRFMDGPKCSTNTDVECAVLFAT
jgi:hypothetical protein